MNVENLSTLKIHKLTQAQYERELEAGRIDENALYLTPDEIYVQNEEPLNAAEGALWVDMDKESDGFSPTASVEQTDNGAVISITDRSGTTTATVTNGVDGYTPTKGADYWTDADKSEMVEGVKASLTPADIGALDKRGDIMSADLHYYGHMYINRNYGGWAKTVGNDLDPNVAKLRNSSLSATETSPTEDGTICWVYE